MTLGIRWLRNARYVPLMEHNHTSLDPRSVVLFVRGLLTTTPGEKPPVSLSSIDISQAAVVLLVNAFTLGRSASLLMPGSGRIAAVHSEAGRAGERQCRFYLPVVRERCAYAGNDGELDAAWLTRARINDDLRALT